MTVPTEAQIEAAARRDWLIRRHGAWFRPNARGYSSEIAGAGTYTEAEARGWDASGIEGLTIVHVSDGRVAGEIAAVLAGADRLRAALSAPPTTDAAGWQHISTAPKSFARQNGSIQGIYLLGFCPDEGASPESCIDVIWWEPMTIAQDGSRGCWFGNGACEVRPTHWCSLPPPPDTAMARQVTQGGRDE